MKLIAKPKDEKKILASVSKKASKKKILKEIEAKSECCVNHLCGCSK